MRKLLLLLVLSIVFGTNSFGQFRSKQRCKVSNCLRTKPENLAVYSSMGILVTTFAINESLIRKGNTKPTLPIYFIGVGLSIANYYLMRKIRRR
jgi:hypothetical protein